MRLTTLTLKNFRNHTDSRFEFAGTTNVLLGDNGQGKTNVIEAISFLCLTKSFYAGSDSDALNFGSELFEIEGMLESDSGIGSKARVAYDAALSKKAVIINGQPAGKFSEVIGRFPVVICSPEHAPITMGSPSERRAFVDFVISQASKVYLTSLVEYRRVLRQRNKVLSEARSSGSDPGGMLPPWDEQLIKHGAFVMARRAAFVAEFAPYLVEGYHHLTGQEEAPSMSYVPFAPNDGGESEESFRALLSRELDEKRFVERRFGVTMAGPHRDEFACTINGHDLRKFASQGQHKTFLVALKIAEFFFLKERCDETPILLLDDIFSELDEHRALRLLEFVGDLSQTFITSTTLHVFDRLFDRLPGFSGKKFFLQQGRVVEEAPLAVS